MAYGEMEGAIMAELVEVVKGHPRDFEEDVIIVAEYHKSGNIREVAEKFNLTYWKAWKLLNRYSVAHKYDKPRICPILVDSDDGELMNLDGMKLRLPNDVYLRIIVIRATDELLWSIGNALGDGTYTDDSFRLLGSSKKLSVELVIKTYVDKLAKTFTKGKYHVDYYVWDENKSDWVRIEDPAWRKNGRLGLKVECSPGFTKRFAKIVSL